LYLQAQAAKDGIDLGDPPDVFLQVLRQVAGQGLMQVSAIEER